jgi:glycosyltransferase involved in cell wall biosynthesis
MGGAQYQARCLLDAVSARSDFETYYLARRAPKQIEPVGYEIVSIGTGRKRGVFGMLNDLPSLYRTLRKLRPAVVYQRGLKAYTGVCAAYCVRYGARLVFHIAHDNDVSPPRGRRWSVRGMVQRLERIIGEYGMRRANAIIAQTEDQARLLRAQYGLHATAVVPNFHPLSREPAGRRSADSFRVIWVANFKPAKNPDIFVDLAGSFADRVGIEFVMIGRPGDPKRYSDLHARIRSLPNFRYLGELPIERVNEEIAISDLFVNTSSGEGFPNTFVQAWLRGVPVVSCFVDPDGCLSKGGGGVLAGDPTRLGSIIGELLADPSRLRELSRSAREYGRRHHGPAGVRRLVELLANEAGPRTGGEGSDANRRA